MNSSYTNRVLPITILALIAGAPGCIGLLGDFAVSNDSPLDGPDSGGTESGVHQEKDSGSPDSSPLDSGAADAPDAWESDTSTPPMPDASVDAPLEAQVDSAPPPACSTDTWTTALGATGSVWKSAFGDPTVDIPNDRLRITYDDVVERQVPIGGSYSVAFDLTLSGGTVFTPTVYVDVPSLPSIRRSGGDMQLGGDSYAGTWDDAKPAGFSGKKIAGTLTAHVTMYVRSQTQQLAVKVEAAGAIYRSGWTAPLTSQQTNVSVFRMIGQNNSSIYTGTDDAVYVGPIRICADLDDAAIDAAYNP